jgi:hypothetical protein
LQQAAQAERRVCSRLQLLLLLNLPPPPLLLP